MVRFLLPGWIYLDRKQYGRALGMLVIFCFLVVELFYGYFIPGFFSRSEIFGGSLFLLALVYSVNFFALLREKTSVGASKKETPEELYEKGRLSCLKQNFELAEIYFDRLLKLKPQDEDAVYQLGKACIELNKKEKARALYKGYLEGRGNKWRTEIEDLVEEALRL